LRYRIQIATVGPPTITATIGKPELLPEIGKIIKLTKLKSSSSKSYTTFITINLIAA
jgi:hypothetical protein